MLKTDDVLEILSVPLLGVIPESEEVLKASNLGTPVTILSPLSAPGRAYSDAARPPRRRRGADDHSGRAPGPDDQAVRPEGGMTIFGFLRKRETASAVARDRLQILLSHERGIDGDRT